MTCRMKMSTTEKVRAFNSKLYINNKYVCVRVCGLLIFSHIGKGANAATVGKVIIYNFCRCPKLNFYLKLERSHYYYFVCGRKYCWYISSSPPVSKQNYCLISLRKRALAVPFSVLYYFKSHVFIAEMSTAHRRRSSLLITSETISVLFGKDLNMQI